jgi:accessory gene regulator B
MISKTMTLLIKHNSALEEKRKIYEYGLSLLYSSIFTTLGTILIYSVLGYFNEIILVMLFFAFLRTFAGGFHASSRTSCFTIFTVLSGSVIWLSQNVSLELYFNELSYGLLLCIIFISIFAPLDTNSKLLKEKQKKDYRKKSILIVLSQSLIIFGLYKMSYGTAALIGVFSVYAVVLTMVLRIIQKKFERRNES